MNLSASAGTIFEALKADEMVRRIVKTKAMMAIITKFRTGIMPRKSAKLARFLGAIPITVVVNDG